MRGQEGETESAAAGFGAAARACGQEGTDMAAELVKRGPQEVTHCSLKPKCIQEGHFPKRNVDSGSGVISSTSLLERCLQRFKDLPECINEEMMQTGSGEAVRSLAVHVTLAVD